MLTKALLVGEYQRKAELLAAEDDIELTVVVPPSWRDGDRVQALERLHTDGYRLLETPIALSGNFHLHWYTHLGRILDESRPELVHIDEEPYNLATRLAMQQARARRARTVFFTWQNMQRRYPPPFSWWERAVYNRIDGAIAGSRTASQVLRAKGYAGPLWTIPQVGVDPGFFSPRPAHRREGRPFRIGFAGRLVHGKGVDLAIEALASLTTEPSGSSVPIPDVENAQARTDAVRRASTLDARLEILGEGPERQALEQLAQRLGVGERVRFRPWMPSSELPAFYHSLDALVLPSRSTPSWIEQFGRVLIEAMACGVACVGSDSGEIPHVIGDAGLVFPEGDSAALRDQLWRLATNDALSEALAEAGRARVLERFTMARVAQETADVYRAVLTGQAAQH
jgi:glycosyltransferase involved in cell wall biosynthesis